MQVSRKVVALSIGVAALIVAVATLLPPSVAERLTESPLYHGIGATTLALVFLTIGWGIDLKEARKHLTLVLCVVAIGVPAKFALTWFLVGVMGQSISPEIVMAMVQVEATSALLIAANRWMSSAARLNMALIAMWDDPATTVAVEIMQGGGSGEVFWATAPYLVLIGVGMLFLAIRRITPQGAAALVSRGKELAVGVSKGIARFRLFTLDVQLTMLVIGVVALAVANGWFTLAAMAGLVFRPSWIKAGVTKADRVALSLDSDAAVRIWEGLARNFLIVAAFLQLGPYLAGEVEVTKGASLGISVYSSHPVVIVSALTLYRVFGGEKAREFTLLDMAFMAVCQLNGLTAVSLGNALGAAAAQIVVVALLVVGFLYVVGNLIVWGLAPPSAGEKSPLMKWVGAPERCWYKRLPMQSSRNLL